MKKEIETKFSLLGGIVPIYNTFVPVSEDELHTIETALGVALPDDYRDFVHTYGASRFGESVYFRFMQPEPIYAVKGLAGKPAPRYEVRPFWEFYGGEDAPRYSFAEAIALYKDRMPDTIIPIGDDGFGHLICLGIKGEERGKVYYWDYENEWDEEDYLERYGEPMPPEVKFQNVYLIAESFEDFILRLEKEESA